MRSSELPPNALVATAESIRGGHFRPDQREPLISAGFDWDRFERILADLQAARVGFARSCYPIRLQLDDPAKLDKAAPILRALAEQLDELRELAPRVLTSPGQIRSRIECTVPDGTPHAELGGVDPAQVHVVALQDSNEFVHHELPALARMTSAWAIYLFGNYLRDAELSSLDFGQFRQLRVLDLAENRLTAIPRGVTGPRLELLSLARNSNLRSLPGDLPRLRSLRLLDLSGTNLSAAAVRQATAALPDCEIRI